MNCPIKLDKIHCQSCGFFRQINSLERKRECCYWKVIGKPDPRTEKQKADLNAMKELGLRRNK